jgi:hypothetical protein
LLPPPLWAAPTLEASVAALDTLAGRTVAALVAADAHAQAASPAASPAELLQSSSSSDYAAASSRRAAAALAAVDAYAGALAAVERRVSRACALGHKLGPLGRGAEANLIDGCPAHLDANPGGGGASGTVGSSSSSSSHRSSPDSTSSPAAARAAVFSFLDEQHRAAQGQDRAPPRAAEPGTDQAAPHAATSAAATSAAAASANAAPAWAGNSSSSLSGVLCPPVEREYVFWRRAAVAGLGASTGSGGAESGRGTPVVRMACAVHEADTFPATRSVRLAFSAPRCFG